MPSDDREVQTSGSDQRPSRSLTGPAMAFDLQLELATLQQEPSWQRNDRNARTLVEEPDFRMVLTALKLGAKLQPHQTAGWVSILVTEGQLRVGVEGSDIDVPAGSVLVLARGERHAVEATDDSAFVVTVAGLESSA